MKARKNTRRITPPPMFSNEGGRQLCSNLWAGFMMRQMDRQERLAAAGLIEVRPWMFDNT